jgi:hypothetical protein
MLVFRKWFLALALVALTAAVAGAADNVPAFQCVANAGVPPIVRAEGIAELMGDLVLNCNNGTPTASGNVPQVNVQIFLNTNITSKVDGDNYSEALLMVDEPTASEQKVCTAKKASGGGCSVSAFPSDPGRVYKPHADVKPYNIFQGRKGGENSIVWLGVPIDVPGTTYTRIIRVTNVRANANSLGTSSTLVPNQIIAYISITGSTSVPINNPQQTVAWIQNGLTFSVRKLNGDSGTPSALLQCVDTASDTYKDPNKTDKYCYTGRLRFAEGFATAFKTRFSVSGAGPYSSLDYQNSPGTIFNISESGFWTADSSIADWPVQLGIPAGMAVQGTRLRAVFNNVPAGVRLFVGINNGGNGSLNSARLVNVNMNDGSGSYAEIPGTGSLQNETDGSCKDWKAATRTFGGDDTTEGKVNPPIAEVVVFGGTGTAVWEVTNTDPLAIQTMDFGFMVAFSANTANNLPGLGSGTVNGMFAPISTITTMSSVAPVPRFADTSSSKTVYVIDPCATNLLFPFVSNQAGFDTGLVISNTSKDPWGHPIQSGVCKLNYYGNTNGGAAPPAQTSAAVPAGDHLIWGLSSGGTLGIAATQGFQGYIIAQCKFQFAHGFAFISDYGNTKTAHGYLALIMDNPKIRDDVSTSETLGQ